MHNPGGYRIYVYTVCIDWQWEDWEIDDDYMWSNCSLFDINMSRSNILQNLQIKINNCKKNVFIFLINAISISIIFNRIK